MAREKTFRSTSYSHTFASFNGRRISSRSVARPQVLRKTQVPPSGPQSCRHGVQEGLILLDTASCVKVLEAGENLRARIPDATSGWSQKLPPPWFTMRPSDLKWSHCFLLYLVVVVRSIQSSAIRCVLGCVGPEGEITQGPGLKAELCIIKSPHLSHFFSAWERTEVRNNNATRNNSQDKRVIERSFTSPFTGLYFTITLSLCQCTNTLFVYAASTVRIPFSCYDILIIP